MLQFNFKSQTTLEFLTTYMWAFLVILIMIGTLAYFGILKPSKLFPDRCTISPKVECLEFKLGETDAGTGILRLRLKNNLAEPIIVTSWDTTSESKTPFSCTQKPTTGIWLSEEIRNIEFTDCNNKDAGLVLGEKGKVNIKMSYYPAKSGSTYSKDIEGEVFTTVTTIETVLTKPECSDDIDNDNNGCIDYDGGDTGCVSPSDTTESGGICPGGGPGGGPGGETEPLNCFVSTSCSDPSETIVFRMFDLKDAHAENPSQTNYDYKVCCRSATDTLSNSCITPDVIPLHLSANTDAHVEKNTQSNFNVNVCLSATSGIISCRYTTSDCLATETCLATISADTDAHVADCATQPFINKICCSIP